jgi:hypothetical protein
MQTKQTQEANMARETELQQLTAEEIERVAGGEAKVSDAMTSLKQLGEILSNVSKTRSEIAKAFARNARA